MRMRAWRQKAGLTLADVAERLGVSVPTVHRWEVGRADPRLSRIKQIDTLTAGMVTATDFAPPDGEAPLARREAA